MLGAELVTSESCIEPHQAPVSRPKSTFAGLRQTPLVASRPSKHVGRTVCLAVSRLTGSLQYDRVHGLDMDPLRLGLEEWYVCMYCISP